MAPRRLGLPITLAIVMIVLLVILIVGWVLLAVFGALQDNEGAVFYWAWLPIGTVFLAVVLGGVITYLVLTIKAVNLHRRQSNFIDSVTHELKSPIASLKLYLQTLTRHHVDQQQAADFYQYMLDDVERLDQLINHLLEVGRAEKGASGNVENLELSELLRHCAATVCQRYRISKGTVTLDLEPCVVRAARVDLDMVFRNLIDNAVKYGGAVPEVHITSRVKPEGTCVVQVADNGAGIPRKLRRKIFGRFVRLGVELERQKQGTGLGLYISRMLVRRLRGQIRLVDREGATGSVFEVELAAVPSAGSGKEVSSASDSIPQTNLP